MANRINHFLFLAFVALQGTITLAQGDIKLDVKGNREVEKASRLTESPKIIDTVLPTPNLNNPRLNLFYPTFLRLETIEPAGIRIVDKLTQLYHSYLKFGIGTEFMPMAEYYFNQTGSRKFKYGAHLQHLSSFGNLPNYAPSSFDRNNVRVFGGIIENFYDLDAEIRFKNDGFQYYGLKNDSISKNQILQRFNDAGFAVNFNGHPKDSGNVNYIAGIDFNNFNTLKPNVDSLSDWRVRENNFALTTGAWYKMGRETFAVDLGVRYNQYNYGVADSFLIDTGLVRRNTVISLKPSATTYAFDNRLRARVGVDFSVDVLELSKAYLYPIAEVKYSLFNDILIPFISISGGLKQQSFKAFSTENPFIKESIQIKNEHRAIDFQAGIKGTISKRVGFNLNGRFAHIKDKALFVLDTFDVRRNQFKVIYDTLNLASLEGSIYFQESEKLKIDAIVRYNSYSLLNNTYAWNLPSMEVILRGKYNLFDKLVTQLDFTLLSGRKALVYAPEPETKLENLQYAKNLGIVPDINLSVEYLYNSRISAFIQLNNAAAQRYLRWYNYPVQSFQLFGGFTVKF